MGQALESTRLIQDPNNYLHANTNNNNDCHRNYTTEHSGENCKATEGSNHDRYNNPHPNGMMNIDFDHIPLIEPVVTRISVYKRESFIRDFLSTNGPPQIILLVLLMAFGFGSVIGVVPAVMTDRYARINHGYAEARDCSDYMYTNMKPQECIDGSADAQTAVAIENLISNLLTFVTSSWIGSISDIHGRKIILVLSMTVSILRPLTLVMIQVNLSMNPAWYYVAGGLSGFFNWMAIALSSLSDVLPKKWRAPGFGLLLAGLSLGFSVAPTLAIVLGHFNVSVLSLITTVTALIVTILFYPETLSPIAAIEAKERLNEQMDGLTNFTDKVLWNFYRPIWELSILNRNKLFRLLTSLAFFSGIVTAADRTLLIYYIEERLGFDDTDIAKLFLLMGCFGIFVQGFVLKLINDCIGERRVVIVAFSLGCVCNLFYGLATNKIMIFIGISISEFVGMSFPTISAIKANNVEASEQGRIQGALYSVSALASAIGPIMMRFVYQYTKDGNLMGPGSMFIFAAAIYTLAIYCAYALPMEANSAQRATDRLRVSSDHSISTEAENETQASICPSLAQNTILV